MISTQIEEVTQIEGEETEYESCVLCTSACIFSMNKIQYIVQNVSNKRKEYIDSNPRFDISINYNLGLIKCIDCNPDIFVIS